MERPRLGGSGAADAVIEVGVPAFELARDFTSAGLMLANEVPTSGGCSVETPVAKAGCETTTVSQPCIPTNAMQTTKIRKQTLVEVYLNFVFSIVCRAWSKIILEAIVSWKPLSLDNDITPVQVSASWNLRNQNPLTIHTGGFAIGALTA
jgi:hypothetical protein